MEILFSPGQNLRKLLDKESFQDEKVVGKEGPFLSQRMALVDGIINATEKKFADLDEGVLNAAKLADLTTWPSDLNDDNKGYCYLYLQLTCLRTGLEFCHFICHSRSIHWIYL